MEVIDVPSLLAGVVAAYGTQLFWIVAKLFIKYRRAKAASTLPEWDDRFWQDADDLLDDFKGDKKP